MKNKKQTNPAKTSEYAIISFVLGLISFIVFPFSGGILSILAIIFGILGLNQINSEKKIEGRGLAVWGIILGFARIILALLFALIAIIWINTRFPFF